MKRLAGSDAGFLFIESPVQTSTCVDLVVLGPATDGRGPLTLDQLHRHVAARLHRVPALRWRLEPVPGGIGHPVWVDDPDFDLGYHLRHEVLAAPGGEAELDALVARQLPGLLDRRHPLWQVVLVDGLADGRQALVFRFHHTLADGAGLVATLGELLGTDGTTDRGPVEADPGRPPVPAIPRPSRLLLTTLRSQLRAWAAGPLLLVRTLRRFRAVDVRREVAATPVPRSMRDAPPSVLNRSPDAARVYARARMPLADLRAVKATADTTLSDVLLCVIAGGLRQYLLARGALPDQPLVVNVPVGNDPEGATGRQTGNVFSNYYAHLATDVAAPRDRLAATVASNAEAKAQLEILGRHTLPDLLDRIPPAVAQPAARMMAERQRAGDANPDFNVLVSNVRADTTAWAVDARPVEHFCMSGPVAEGAGLNITVTGTGDQVTMAVVANPAAVDAPHELAALLEDSLRELVDAYETAVA